MANDHVQVSEPYIPPGKTWLRAEEVAAYLDISKSSVFRLIKTGDILIQAFWPHHTNLAIRYFGIRK